MNDAIASLELVAVFAGGHQVRITARIGRAHADDKGGWICPIELAPLYAEQTDIRGIDSFHATWLACSLILKLLSHLNAEGVALVHDDGSEFPLEAYLAGLEGGKPRDAAGG